MKKIIVFITVIILTATVSAFAQSEDSLRFEFSSVPASPVESAGWINVNSIVELSDNEATITVYNDGNEDIFCYLSARAGDKWEVVSITEQIKISSGTYEEIVMSDVQSETKNFLLELRELYEGAIVYVKGKDVDYSSLPVPGSDLGSHFKVNAAKMPDAKENTVEPIETNETPQTTSQTTQKAEKTPVTTQKPVQTATAELKEESAVFTPAEAYVTVTTLVAVSVISALAGVVTGGILVFFLIVRKKDGKKG